MAILLTAAGEEYIVRNSSPISTTGAICVWFKPNSVGVLRTLAEVQNSSGTHYCRLQITSTNNLRIAVAAGGAEVTSDSVGSMSKGTWYHCAGLLTNSTSRSCFLNGIQSTPETTSLTLSGIKRFTVGAIYDGTNASSFIDGSFMELAVYNSAIGADIVLSLSEGFSPQAVSNAGLAFYRSLLNDLLHPYFGNGFDSSTGWSYEKHGRVYMPSALIQDYNGVNTVGAIEDLDGTVTAVSATTGKLRYDPAKLKGTITCLSQATAIAPSFDKKLTGTIPAVSNTIAPLLDAKINFEAAPAIACTSNASAVIDLKARLGIPTIPAIACSTTVVANPNEKSKFPGSICVVVSTVNGIVKRRKRMTGTVTALTAVNGIIDNTIVVELTGTIPSVSNVPAVTLDVKVFLRAVGSIVAISNVPNLAAGEPRVKANLDNNSISTISNIFSTNLKIKTRYSGTVTVISNTTGIVDIKTFLEGSISAISSVNGILNTDDEEPVDGSLAAISNVLGNVDIRTRLAGTIPVQSGTRNTTKLRVKYNMVGATCIAISSTSATLTKNTAAAVSYREGLRIGTRR